MSEIYDGDRVYPLAFNDGKKIHWNEGISRRDKLIDDLVVAVVAADVAGPETTTILDDRGVLDRVIKDLIQVADATIKASKEVPNE